MRKLLIGCGVVAGLGVLLLVIGGMVASSWFKSQFPDAERIEELQAQARERFGDPDDFVPPTDGTLPADRVAIFVALRDSFAEKRDAAAVGLAQLAQAGESRRAKRPDGGKPSKIEELSEIFRFAQGGAAMLAGTLDYATSVEKSMLAAGMGLGEYQWYYVLTTWAWLGFDPRQHAGDTPEVGEHVDEAYRNIALSFDRQLANAQRALEAKPARTPAEEDLLRRIRTELENAERRGSRFAGAVPPAWERTLTPDRGRLQAALPDRPAEVLLDLLTGRSGDNFRFDWHDRKRRRHAETESTLSI